MIMGQIIGPPHNGTGNLQPISFPIDTATIVASVVAAGVGLMLLGMVAAAGFFLVRKLFARIGYEVPWPVRHFEIKGRLSRADREASDAYLGGDWWKEQGLSRAQAHKYVNEANQRALRDSGLRSFRGKRFSGSGY